MVAVVLALLGGGGVGPPTAQMPQVSAPAAGPMGEPGEGSAAARSAGTPGAYAAALRQAVQVPSSPLGSLHGWRSRGPRPLGGRLTDLALAPDGTVYAASASGGLWASHDAGRTLTTAWPADATPAVGAVAVTAGGAVLAGTGEANGGGGSLTYGGDGVFRSDDGGATWSPSGLTGSGTVADIEPHPTDPDVVWLAAGGDLFEPGGERGIYRSGDGGRTWQQVLPPATPTTGGADIAVDPADPDHLLAATWDRQRTPALRRYGGPGSGLHRSTDGGRTWTPVGGGLPGFTADAGRIAVAFSPAAPSRVFAVVTRGDGRAGGLWRSDDRGATWLRVDDDPVYEPTQFIFAWWFGRVFPAPDDPDRVLVPGLSLLESTDGGVTFRIDARVHADQHDLVWDPTDPSTAWLATDGGMFTSTASGRPLTWEITADQPFTQVYDVAVPPAAPDAVVAGFQDIGCWVTPGGSSSEEAGQGGWRRSASCGDGTTVLVHPDRPAEVVVCGQYGRCRRSTDLGVTTQALPTPDDGRAAWAAPLIRLPDDPDVLLYGGTRVHRSDDAGATWAALSDDLTRAVSPDPDYPFGTITALTAGPGGRVLAAGTDDGLVWRSDDGGATWDRVVDQDRWVTALELLPTGAGGGPPALLIGTSGYRAGRSSPQVLLVEAASPPRPIGDGLPQAPVNDLVLIDAAQPIGEPAAGGTTLIAATDVGVYASFDVSTESGQTAHEVTSPTWRRVGPDLPQAPVTSLDWVPAQRQLTVGTYGRGLWRTVLPGLTRHAGTDRYATAAAIVRTLPIEGVDTVLLASGADFPDALAAAAVAAGDPAARVVLTRPDLLPVTSADLLTDLAPQQIVVVGGAAAVGAEAVRQALAAAPGASVRRVAGPDRHATAAALAADRFGDTAGAGTVVLATGTAPSDALAGAPYAAVHDAPVLLVEPARLPDATAEALHRLAPSTVVALGGAAAISDGVLQRVGALTGVTPSRIAGPTRVHTAAALAGAMPPTALDPATGGAAGSVWLASASGFADALSAAATGWPVLLSGDSLPDVSLSALTARRPLHVRVAGGPAAVPPAVLDRLVGR